MVAVVQHTVCVRKLEHTRFFGLHFVFVVQGWQLIQVCNRTNGKWQPESQGKASKKKVRKEKTQKNVKFTLDCVQRERYMYEKKKIHSRWAKRAKKNCSSIEIALPVVFLYTCSQRGRLVFLFVATMPFLYPLLECDFSRSNFRKPVSLNPNWQQQPTSRPHKTSC